MSESDVAALRKRAMGWSVSLEPVSPGLDLGRDLSVVRGPGGLDLARVEGLECLAQSLSVALTTLLGDDVFNRRFGFDGLNALAEEPDPALARERVRIGIIKVLREDPRVRRIVDVNLSGDGRLEAPAAGSRQLEVRVVFETPTGEQAAVSLGKGNSNV